MTMETDIDSQKLTNARVVDNVDYMDLEKKWGNVLSSFWKGECMLTFHQVYFDNKYKIDPKILKDRIN